jgi:hypothetical protein
MSAKSEEGNYAPGSRGLAVDTIFRSLHIKYYFMNKNTQTWNQIKENTSLIEIFSPLYIRISLFSGPLSIVELKIQQAEIDSLVVWIKSKSLEIINWLEDSRQASILDKTFSNREMIGLLLLTVATSLCRENSPENSIWTVIKKIFSETENIQKRLFPGGQPSFLFKQALVKSIQKTKLRNALAFEGKHQYYDSIKLQFGFTYKGACKHLAEWLVGVGVPFSVRLLLGDELDPELESRSFKDLWSNLKLYRQDKINDGEIRGVLKKSPWIKNNWINSLLIQARAKLQISEKTLKSAGVNQEYDEKGYVNSFKLVWETKHKPRIKINIDRETVVSAAEENDVTKLNFSIDNRIVERWQLQPNNQWLGSDLIFCEPRRLEDNPNLTPKILSISSAEGQIIDEIDLSESIVHDDIVLYDITSEMFLPSEESQLDPTREIVILCNEDLVLEGTSNQEWIKIGNHRIYRLIPPWTEAIKIMLDDIIFWEPQIVYKNDIERFSLEVATPNNKSVKLGNKSILTISGVPDDALDVKLYIGKQCFKTDKKDGTWYTKDEIEISTEIAMKQVKIRPRIIRADSERVYYCKVNIAVLGLIIADDSYRSNDDYIYQDSSRDLNIANGKIYYKIYNGNSKSKSMIYEGFRLSEISQKRSLSTSNFIGCGDVLFAETNNEILPLASSCIDRGHISFYFDKLLGTPTSKQIRFRWPIEFSKYHKLYALLPNEFKSVALYEIPGDKLIRKDEDGCWWEIIDAIHNPLSIALSYKGKCLGAHWDTKRLIQLLTNSSLLEMFALLRWLKFPLLARDNRDEIREVIWKNPIDFLKAYILNEGLPDYLLNKESDEWVCSIVRNYLWNWDPGLSKKTEMPFLKLFWPDKYDSKNRAIVNQIIIISKLCPPLLRVYKRNIHNMRKALNEGLLELLGLPVHASHNDVSMKMGEIRIKMNYIFSINRNMDIEEEFSNSTINEKRLSRDYEKTIRRLGEKEMGRVYLSAALLKTFIKRIS